MRFFLWFGFCCILISTACRKDDQVTTDPRIKLYFSTDTVFFDTVFTSVGSVNRRIKVYNTNEQTLQISNIKLGGGAGSFFSLIINGEPVNEKDNVKIYGNDSISIFVKATIDPNNLNQPFIVEDSVIFNTNGNLQKIPLRAYGQNAVFINGESITSDTHWGTSLPYIINKSVTVEEGSTLTVAAGARVLFHGSAAMNIKGTLNVIGTFYNPAAFESDRLEDFYDNEPGQWLGIHFSASSVSSRINYALIKNAVIGLTADSLSTNGSPKLLLTNSIVKNMTVSGLVAYQSYIAGFNNLFYNSGQYLFYASGGGSYSLKQNTFAGFNTNFPRRTPALYFSDSGNGHSGDLNVELTNNIIWGVLPEELFVERKTTATITGSFNTNIIKTASQTYADNNFLNMDPKFLDIQNNFFRLQAESPAIGKGTSLVADPFYTLFLKKDLSGKDRSFPSNLGCFEQ